jgi:hypothetical protein
LFIISAPQPKKLEEIWAPQAKFLEVDEQKTGPKNEIGDLGAPKNRGALAVAQIAIP